MTRRIGWCCLLGLVCWSIGCDRPADVSRYQVPSEPSLPAATTGEAPTSSSPQRMLAAIIPVDGQVWFFKAMGPVAQVEQVASEFQQLLSSIDFPAPDKPSWTLPEGWTQQPGNQFRFATLVARGLEVTVSSLPAPNGDASPQYVVDNVNRWRNQLQLSPITVDQIPEATESIEIGGRSAYRVDLTGVASANPPMMRGPFQPSEAGSGAPATSSPPTNGPARGGGLTFTKPESWQEGGGSSFRLASFTVERDGRAAEITVIALGPSAGSLLDNVNRWRGQINLPSIDQGQLDALIQTLEVDGTPSQFVRISEPQSGAKDAILAVIVPRPEQTVFIKMMGPSDLVLAESDAFEQFVGSLRFASR